MPDVLIVSMANHRTGLPDQVVALLAENHVCDRRTLVLAWLRSQGFKDTMLEKCSWTGGPVIQLTEEQLQHPPIEG